MLETNFSPFPEIRTERLLLRRFTEADAPVFFKLRTDERAMKYIDREPSKDVAEVDELIRKINTNIETGTAIAWCIDLADHPGVMIGTISFWRIIHENHRAETGYMLHPDHWGKGLIKEAISAVIRYGFDTLKLHSIEAHINPGNIASAAVLERMGFVREAYFKEDYYFRGEFKDTAIYSLLAG